MLICNSKRIKGDKMQRVEATIADRTERFWFFVDDDGWNTWISDDGDLYYQVNGEMLIYDIVSSMYRKYVLNYLYNHGIANIPWTEANIHPTGNDH